MRTNSEIISLIQSKAEERKMSMSELARNVGIAKSTMSRYFNKTREFPLNRADDFAKALNISTEFLLGIDLNNEVDSSELLGIYRELEEQRRMIVLDTAKEQLEEQTKIINFSDKKTDIEDIFEVKGTTFAAAASGFGRGFEADDYDTYTVYTDEEPPHYDYAIGIRGDSMLPKYEQGDMLYIVDKGMSTYSGQLCIVVHNGNTYFKKVYTEDDGLRLVSLNKKYSDIFIDYPPAEDTYIKIYDVVGSFTPIEF
ncbi:LexA family transcriptional regulator [Streptococcus dysgalactiae]|uniref:Phage repressor protein C with HTH and peptisase S24 domain n=1 Tax=Streptococcus dysgalactiae TaxID=1334 RepID=A0ABU0A948_STRDY|nr:helix-turn-helix transcriptional regulator [Streptococcus dysgalactiae]MDQ0263027.1 phage repressor protein C with HTH and peptisase S24 domain [Streptococcus dysgalactiae]OCW99301.1 repressor [Streptococcus dysgalactiae subsp. equisimilis]QQC55997.1 helix-turn-helix transcriptional regulator [Streptococcus dysgalactiae]SUN67292.1 cI-like repressor [Streptococcus dysgalactiae]SUN70565.1 cI-like repressor [Streptococcus dysgalactiae]